MKRNLTDFPQKPKKPKKLWSHSDSKKLEAVKLWMLTGNLMHTAAALNLPFPTVRNWRYSDWWKRLVEELRTEEQIQLTNRLRGIAEKSLVVLEDRLENGDWIFNRALGTLERKPVSLRDATQTFNSIHDRKTKNESRPREESKEAVDRLTALAQKFEEMVNKRQPIQVTDVIFGEDNALYDQREEGLQERISMGTQEETQPSQG